MGPLKLQKHSSLIACNLHAKFVTCQMVFICGNFKVEMKAVEYKRAKRKAVFILRLALTALNLPHFISERQRCLLL